MTDFAFVDTTAFRGARDLSSTSWTKIADGIDQGVLRAGVSEVSVMESARHAHETIDAKIKSIGEAAKTLGTYGVDVQVPARPDPDDLGTLLPDWLRENGFDIAGA